MLKKIFEENLSPTEAAEFVLNVIRCRHSDPHIFFEQIEAGEFKSFGEVLKHAFAWDDTEQGFEYWRDILEREGALEYDEPHTTCIICNGSGEGMWDGSTCDCCKGSGIKSSDKF